MMEWANLAAIIIIPVAAVLIGQWLQDRAKKREDKKSPRLWLLILTVFIACLLASFLGTMIGRILFP